MSFGGTRPDPRPAVLKRAETLADPTVQIVLFAPLRFEEIILILLTEYGRCLELNKNVRIFALFLLF